MTYHRPLEPLPAFRMPRYDPPGAIPGRKAQPFREESFPVTQRMKSSMSGGV
jgi:hypothetical protein